MSKLKLIEVTGQDNRPSVQTIDFGTGKIFYQIEDGSAIVIKELMDALKNAAMVVPLPILIKRINQGNRF